MELAEKFKIVSSRPSSVFVEGDLLNSRLDSKYFLPEYLEMDILLNKLSESNISILRLDDIIDILTDFTSNGSFANLKSNVLYSDSKTGVPFIRILNMSPPGINNEDLLYVEQSTYNYLKKSKLEGGELLYSKTGENLGLAVIFPENFGKATLADNIFLLKLKDNIDNRYIMSFLNCKYGQYWTRRLCQQSAQPTIVKESFREIKIPVPDKKIQSYIGNKVRLAEKCRSEVKKSRETIKILLNEHADILTLEKVYNESKKKTNHYINYSLVNDRLDSEFYSPANLELERIIKNKPWIKLSKLIKLVSKGVPLEYNLDGSVPALTVTNIDPEKINTNSNQKVTENWALENKKAMVQPNEIIITVTGPPLGELAVAHNFHGKITINGDLAKLQNNDNFPYPNYISTILNTVIGSSQVTKYSKGVRQKHLYPSEILDFIIPNLDIAIVKQIDELGKKADILEYLSGQLITEAKKDVEDLIEGKLDTEGIISGRIKEPTWDDIEKELSQNA